MADEKTMSYLEQFRKKCSEHIYEVLNDVYCDTCRYNYECEEEGACE